MADENDNVVYLNQEEYAEVAGQSIKKPRTRDEYLKTCKRFLDQFCYEELLCSILDKDYYDLTEPEIQQIVDNYFTFPH